MWHRADLTLLAGTVQGNLQDHRPGNVPSSTKYFPTSCLLNLIPPRALMWIARRRDAVPALISTTPLTSPTLPLLLHARGERPHTLGDRQHDPPCLRRSKPLRLRQAGCGTERKACPTMLLATVRL